MSLSREIKSRARQVAPQVALACLLGYFVFHAMEGSRGFRAWVVLKQEIAAAEQRLSEVSAERRALEAKVALLRPEHLDPDMLEERARILLNYGRESDYIILLPQDAAKAAAPR